MYTIKNILNPTDEYSTKLFQYDDVFLKKISKSYSQIQIKCENLTEPYLNYYNNTAEAREYATHGFCRRLKTMTRCIDNIFRLLPPELSNFPKEKDKLDAEINIQAFIFNAFGALDNLAWIWVEEKEITTKNCNKLSNHNVGLIYKFTDQEKDKYKILRDKFSNEFQNYLTSLEQWFSNLTNFRHALAHKIPLYIPPTVPYSQVEDYNKLVRQKEQANLAKFKTISIQQEQLKIYAPLISHSIQSTEDTVYFHPTLLSHFLTIEEIAIKFLKELDG